MDEKKLTLLLEMRKKYSRCKTCELHLQRKRIVFGRGGFNKGIMIVGEAPGPMENEQGNPFIGRAGKMLDKLMHIAGLLRNDTFITNSVLCYPGRDGDGGFNQPDELQLIRCVPRLKRMVNILKPKLIIILGNTAMFSLLCRRGIEKFGGLGVYSTLNKDGTKKNFPVYVTYHPSGVLRNPDYKEAVVKDWKRIGEFVNGPSKQGKISRPGSEGKLC